MRFLKCLYRYRLQVCLINAIFIGVVLCVNIYLTSRYLRIHMQVLRALDAVREHNVEISRQLHVRVGYKVTAYTSKLNNNNKPSTNSRELFKHPPYDMDKLWRCNSCMDLNFTFIINPTWICKPSPYVQLVILIESATQNVQRRNAIRKTWGKICRSEISEIKCVFVLADADDYSRNKLIAKEAQDKKDILQIGFKDSYRNLTYKTVMAIKWTVQHCSNARYALKCDDDIVVNTEQMSLMLKAAPTTKLYGGNCGEGTTPRRYASSKWYVSYDEYPGNRYPPRCSGAAYLMSQDVFKSVYERLKHVPFIYLEDIYIGFVASLLHIRPQAINGFCASKFMFTPCYYRHYVFTFGYFANPTQLENAWAQMHDCPYINISAKRLYIATPI